MTSKNVIFVQYYHKNLVNSVYGDLTYYIGSEEKLHLLEKVANQYMRFTHDTETDVTEKFKELCNGKKTLEEQIISVHLMTSSFCWSGTVLKRS